MAERRQSDLHCQIWASTFDGEVVRSVVPTLPSVELLKDNAEARQSRPNYVSALETVIRFVVLLVTKKHKKPLKNPGVVLLSTCVTQNIEGQKKQKFAQEN